ncbi:E3 ubiquitin-protein ligase ICP0 [Diplonema papillatum]|nr:E3 ubiquitin-protein ligase ICP0 [Diplonema papillatum]
MQQLLWRRKRCLPESIADVKTLTPEFVTSDIDLAVVLSKGLHERYPKVLPSIGLKLVKPPANGGIARTISRCMPTAHIAQQLATMRVRITLDGSSTRVLTGDEFYRLCDQLTATHYQLLVGRGGSKDDEVDECSICFERSYENTVLSCLHTFCSECVAKWAQESASCPMCRAPAASHHVLESNSVVLDGTYESFSMTDEEILEAMIQSIDRTLCNFLHNHKRAEAGSPPTS